MASGGVVPQRIAPCKPRHNGGAGAWISRSATPPARSIAPQIERCRHHPERPRKDQPDRPDEAPARGYIPRRAPFDGVLRSPDARVRHVRARDAIGWQKDLHQPGAHRRAPAPSSSAPWWRGVIPIRPGRRSARSAPERDATPATHVRGLNRSCLGLLTPPESYDGKWAVAAEFLETRAGSESPGRARAPPETEMAYGCRLAESLGATRTRSPASSFR